MNKFAVLTVIILLSCNSANDPQNQIKDYIKQNINDPASYEPVSFGERQNDSTTFWEDGYVKMLDDSAEYWQQKKLRTDNYDSIDKYLGNYIAVIDRAKLYLTNFKGRPKGYYYRHIFRRKNKAAGIVLDTISFCFDSSMNLRDLDYKTAFNKD